MPNITLPDGSTREYKSNITVAEVALDIGEGLARAALAGQIDKQLVDLDYVISKDIDLSIITSKNPEGIEILRNSASYLLTVAVKEIFPDIQLASGHLNEDGFYYDFSYKRPFTPEDLILIEKKMYELSKKNSPILKKSLERNQAIKLFNTIGEGYKVKIIEEDSSEENISLYGLDKFIDI